MNTDILVGKILRPRGLHGQLLVKSLTDFPKDRFVLSAEIVSDNINYPLLTISSAEFKSGNELLLKFKEITNRNDAESIGKAKLFINDKNTFLNLESDDFQVANLISLDVFSRKNNFLGKIKNIENSPAHDLLEIELENKNTFLVPFVKEIVLEVNELQKKIIVDLPEGLVEMNIN